MKPGLAVSTGHLDVLIMALKEIINRAKISLR